MLAKAKKLLDDQHVPTKGRFLRFAGKDGNVYELQGGKKILAEVRAQFPDWLVALGENTNG